MIVAFDAQMVIWALDPHVHAPFKRPGGLEVDHQKDRVWHLIERLTAEGHHVIIPAPAMAEFMVRVPASRHAQALAMVARQASMRVAPFDGPEAAEAARLMAGRPLGTGEPGGRVAIKFDIQIVAVAAVAGARRIYSSDGGVRALASTEGIEVVAIWELPLPPVEQDMFAALPPAQVRLEPLERSLLPAPRTRPPRTLEFGDGGEEA